MKGSEQGKKKYKIQFEESKRTRKFNVGAKSCVQRNKNFRERPTEKWNRGRDAPWVRPCPANPTICEKKKRPKEQSIPKEQQQIKAYTNKIQGVGQGQSQAGSRTRQHHPLDSGCRVMKN